MYENERAEITRYSWWFVVWVKYSTRADLGFSNRGGGGAQKIICTHHKREVPSCRGPALGCWMLFCAIWALFWNILIQNGIWKKKLGGGGGGSGLKLSSSFTIYNLAFFLKNLLKCEKFIYIVKLDPFRL